MGSSLRDTSQEKQELKVWNWKANVEKKAYPCLTYLWCRGRGATNGLFIYLAWGVERVTFSLG